MSEESRPLSVMACECATWARICPAPADLTRHNPRCRWAEESQPPAEEPAEILARLVAERFRCDTCLRGGEDEAEFWEQGTINTIGYGCLCRTCWETAGRAKGWTLMAEDAEPASKMTPAQAREAALAILRKAEQARLEAAEG